MRRSDVSGKYVLREKSVVSVKSKRIGLPEEHSICEWSGNVLLRDEVGRCALTGLLVCQDLLNNANELALLRDLLDGRSRYAFDADGLIPQIRSLNEAVFHGLKHVRTVKLKKHPTVAVCAEIHSWFGIKVRYVGFVMRTAAIPKIIGQGVSGFRNVIRWVLEEQLEFP